MPYTKESRVLPEDAQICYMVLTPPLVGSLDYTIRVHEELVKDPDGGTSYHSRWELANTDGPAPRPGITRVTINEGSWLLESIGNQTRATYTLYTDGGCIPPLLMNFANKQSVSRLFDALHAYARWGIGVQRIVIALLVKMGYGGSRADAAQAYLTRFQTN